ncbi:MAG: SPFH domain-containing protein [Planctomycetota bacterium]|jgi:regulator of protease activity HflC (stomatin/prohibitin superfamily)
MSSIKYVSILIVLSAIAAFLIVSFTVTTIPAGQVGVRIQQYAFLGDKGVVKEDFGPGYQRAIWPIDTWAKFDSTIQTLEMTRDPHRGSQSGRDDIEVRTADGSTVSVDVTVKYRIQPGKAHKLLQEMGRGDRYKNVVRTEAQEICMALFGKITTEDFYNPFQRTKVRVEALTALQASLADNYVEVVDLLIRDVQFDPAYERSIQEKKLADQRTEVNKSKKLAGEEQGKTMEVKAETNRQLAVIIKEKEGKLVEMQAGTKRAIAKIRADAGKYATQKRADADLIAAELLAKGQLQVKQAEAEGERLRNRAMMGVGGSTIVALEAARNLNLKSATISTLETDLLDVDKMARKLGAEGR